MHLVFLPIEIDQRGFTNTKTTLTLPWPNNLTLSMPKHTKRKKSSSRDYIIFWNQINELKDIPFWSNLSRFSNTVKSWIQNKQSFSSYFDSLQSNQINSITFSSTVAKRFKKLQKVDFCSFWFNWFQKVVQAFKRFSWTIG